MNYEEPKVTVIMKYFMNLLRIKIERTRNYVVARCISVQSIILSETVCQIILIGRVTVTAIKKGETEKNKSNTQWITGTEDYFYRFLKFDTVKFDV